MIRKIKVTDYPRLIEIWESAVLSTHDFLKEEDFLYYKEQLPVYFQYVALFGFEQEGILIGFMRIAEENLEMLFIIKILVRDLLIKSEHLLFSIKVFFYVYHITYNGAIQYPCIMLCRSDIGMSQNLRYIFH